MKHILVMDDDADTCMALESYLQSNGFRVSTVGDGRRLGAALADGAYDLLLLDAKVPGEDGLDLCRSVRERSRLPIVMMSTRGEEVDRLVGLELGADDYICKPFSPREVVARVKAVLRRGMRAEPATQGLAMDEERYEATLDGAALELTPVEFRLLKALASRPGRIFPRGQLLDAPYDDHRVVSDRTVDSHVKNLRRKLEGVRHGMDLVRSVYGVGYKLEL